MAATIALLGIVVGVALSIVTASVFGGFSGGSTASLDPLAMSTSLTASTPSSPKATGKQSLSDDDVGALSRGFDPAW